MALLCSCQPTATSQKGKEILCDGDCGVEIPSVFLITENINIGTRCYYNQDETHYFMVNSFSLEEKTLFVDVSANLYMDYSLNGHDYSVTEVDNYASKLILDKGYAINRGNMYREYANSGLLDDDKEKIETIAHDHEISYRISYDLSNCTYWNGGEALAEDYPDYPSLYISFILDAKVDNEHPYNYRRLLLYLANSEIKNDILNIID